MDNLVASYLFIKDITRSRPEIYDGIYRYYGIVIYKVKNSVWEIKYWLNEFQKRINESMDNLQLQFISKMWTNESTPPPPNWKAGQGSNEHSQKIKFPGHKDKLVPWGGPGIWIIQEKRTSIKDEHYKQYNLWKRIKINPGVKRFSTTLLKSAQSLLPSYLPPCTNQRQ